MNFIEITPRGVTTKRLINVDRVVYVREIVAVIETTNTTISYEIVMSNDCSICINETEYKRLFQFITTKGYLGC